MCKQFYFRQSDEMEKAVPKVGISLTDRDINDMATCHFAETQVNPWFIAVKKYLYMLLFIYHQKTILRIDICFILYV